LKILSSKISYLPLESYCTAYLPPAHNQICNDPIRCDLRGKGRNLTHRTSIFITFYTGLAEEVTTHVVINRIIRYLLTVIMKKKIMSHFTTKQYRAVFLET
jgi:hypothetical protein